MTKTTLSATPVLDFEKLLERGIRTLATVGEIEEIQSLARGEAEDPIDMSGMPPGTQRPRRLPDHGKVLRLATKALACDSKEIEIVIYLAEAAIWTHGAVGLRDSLRVVRQLHENFWEEMRPVIEKLDDPKMIPPKFDAGRRAARLSQFAIRIARAVYQFPITAAGPDGCRRSWQDRETAGDFTPSMSATSLE